MKRLLVMDVEGTLFKAEFKINGTDYSSTMWQPIANALGDAAVEAERQTHEKWENKKYDNYMEWVRASIEIHRKYGLKRDIFDSLIEQAEYSEGVEEFFSNLNRDKWIPVLISGGFQNLIRRAEKELDIDYGFGACEYYWDNEGYLEHFSLQPSDFDGKTKFLDNLLREYGLNKKTDWVFIGDGKNDFAIANQAPMAFGIHPHEKLREVDGLIEIQSFMDILPYLDKMDTSKKSEKEIVNKSIPKKTETDEDRLKQNIMELKKEIRGLKNKLNAQNIKAQSKNVSIEVFESDYTKTPRIPLVEILEGTRCVFIGLDENIAAYRRLSNIGGLKVVSGVDKNFNTDILKNVEFLFAYKNYAAHPSLWRAAEAVDASTPICLLKEHTNEDLLQNAMANVLYRYIYK